ncbi:DEKNAAC102750 [Brettanomyces naardenensis]|uniref:Pre-mRNA-processing protein 45 n=1 Tax=Brettanomyces naardenensis TaxID=13370 RepID=A0A448YKG0_BRENA|nr:DEKNAAC102750 [Brettanomyces naardenensis]
MSRDIEETTARTREAIQKIIDAKQSGSKVTSSENRQEPAAYIRYTPSTAVRQSSTKKQRVIKIVDRQQDPTLPPAFKIRKTPQGPNEEAPVPILHEESTAKLTKEEQKKWSIPPAISNWKNTKGFTISIDKRLASMAEDKSRFDVSDRFGALSEALDKANNEAKEELKMRARLKQKLEKQKLLESQKKLGRIAREARSASKWGTEEEGEGRIEDSVTKREQARRERRRKAERELRIGSMSTEAKVKMLAKGQGREVSERIAVGVAAQTEDRRRKDVSSNYDSKLYLKAAGTNTRHSEDQIYDSALFGGQEAVNDIYRARDSSRFKGLGSGSEESSAKDQLRKLGTEKRFEGLSDRFEESSGPVVFEKDKEGSDHKKPKTTGLARKREWDE